MERERVREKEPVQKGEGEHYEDLLRANATARERARTGQIVIRGKDLPWRQSRMGFTKGFLAWNRPREEAAEDWTVFIKDLKIHSGKHRHQGGIQLFILEGEGCTVVDGQPVDW